MSGITIVINGPCERLAPGGHHEYQAICLVTLAPISE